jgi:hypothetical protein
MLSFLTTYIEKRPEDGTVYKYNEIRSAKDGKQVFFDDEIIDEKAAEDPTETHLFCIPGRFSSVRVFGIHGCGKRREKGDRKPDCF